MGFLSAPYRVVRDPEAPRRSPYRIQGGGGLRQEIFAVGYFAAGLIRMQF